MRRDYVDDWSSYDYSDPYYTDYAYGGGWGYDHPNYYGPNWSCPGGGYGPGMGAGGAGGNYHNQWDWGGYWSGCYGGSMAPGDWIELMQLVRDTNQCCRQMLQMMQQMHQQHQGQQKNTAAE